MKKNKLKVQEKKYRLKSIQILLLLGVLGVLGVSSLESRSVYAEEIQDKSEVSDTQTTTTTSDFIISEEQSKEIKEEQKQSQSVGEELAEKAADETAEKSEEPVKSNEGQVPIYRLYNPNSGEHLHTLNLTEKNRLSVIGWQYEGISMKVGSDGVDVYRAYNPNSGEHLWTLNHNEIINLKNNGWQDEGLAWKAPKEGVPVYRVFNPKAKDAGSHHYTLSKGEVNTLEKSGWRYEGIAWYSYGGEEPVLPPVLEYQIKGTGEGWQGAVKGGTVTELKSGSKQIEAVKLKVSSSLSGNIEYATDVQNSGWKGYFSDFQVGGIENRRLEAFKVRLTGELAQYYDVYYHAKVEGRGWLDWTKNDGISGTQGVGKKIEGIQIRIIGKGQAAPQVGKSFLTPSDMHNPDINRNAVLAKARSYISDYYYNPTANIFTSRYNKPHNGWCTLFIEYVFDEAGVGNLFYEGRYEWDPQVVYPYHRDKGQVVKDPLPGDIAFVDWQGRGHITHAEIVEAAGPAGIQVITGNWGNRVMRVLRPRSQVVAFIRPNY